ncbi:MAG: YwiC-like family protein [Polyangiales bacterium]
MRPTESPGENERMEAAPRVWLMPREHGAYALVLAPLLTAFCRGEPSWAGLGFAVLAVAAFLAHEPALVLLGHRGVRAKRELGAVARRALVRRGLVTVLAGAGALVVAPRAALEAFIVLGVLGALQAFVALRRAEKSDVGTLLLALSASLSGVPVALSNGWAPEHAWLTAGVFAVTGALAMLTVRELIPKRRRAAGVLAYVGFLSVAVAVIALVTRVLRGEVDPAFAWALVPTLSVAVGLLLVRPSPRRLRVVGWSLAAAKVATVVVLVLV